ncbi:MAG: hypothetical protein OEV01_02705 [Nitrospira sp.]|nr:hypothetical protein [Nitrospira sp.]MDH4303883.1 hypothetical protein [Nitrospira sp.]
MDSITEQDIAHALDVLGLTLPFTIEDLERAKRVQLYTWSPTRYAGLTNNPAQYMQQFRKAEDMTKTVEAAYALISTVFIPDDADPDGRGTR